MLVKSHMANGKKKENKKLGSRPATYRPIVIDIDARHTRDIFYACRKDEAAEGLFIRQAYSVALRVRSMP